MEMGKKVHFCTAFVFEHYSHYVYQRSFYNSLRANDVDTWHHI